jgi:hypothetical protein
MIACRSRKLPLTPDSATVVLVNCILCPSRQRRAQSKRYARETYARFGLGPVIEARNSGQPGREVKAAINKRTLPLRICWKEVESKMTLLSGGMPLVAMVETADLRNTHDTGLR